MTTILINDVEVRDDHPMVATWRDDSDRLREAAAWIGTESGKLLITLGADGMFNLVDADLHGTGTVAAIDEAIATLQRLRAALDAVPDLNPGQCLHYGDWGRCRGRHRHGGLCDFPVEPTRGATR